MEGKYRELSNIRNDREATTGSYQLIVLYQATLQSNNYHAQSFTSRKFAAILFLKKLYSLLCKLFSVLIVGSMTAVWVNEQRSIRQLLLNSERVESRNHEIVLK